MNKRTYDSKLVRKFATEIKNNENMEELNVKANKYAEENVINVLKEAFAMVYADGYRDGYKDCKEEIPVDMRLNETEFIDLGLPSGTLWSTDYEKDEGELMYVPYELTAGKSIPTKEQWEELKKCAKWEFIGKEDKLTAVKCTGPNGNTLLFRMTGLMEHFATITSSGVFFWARSTGERNCAVHMWISDNKLYEYAGYDQRRNRRSSILKLPIRLVRVK